MPRLSARSGSRKRSTAPRRRCWRRPPRSPGTTKSAKAEASKPVGGARHHFRGRLHGEPDWIGKLRTSQRPPRVAVTPFVVTHLRHHRAAAQVVAGKLLEVS